MSVDLKYKILTRAFVMFSAVCLMQSNLAQAANENNNNLMVDWSVFIGGTSDESMSDITVDSDGNLYVIGVVTLTDDLLGHINNLREDALRGSFLSKISPAGQVEWAKYFDQVYFSGATSMEIDGDGNILVAGTSTHPSRFPRRQEDPQAYHGRVGFVWSVSPDGETNWTTYIKRDTLAEQSSKSIRGMSILPDGSIVLHGFAYSPDLEKRVNEKTVLETSERFTALISAEGELQWTRYLGIPHEQRTRPVYQPTGAVACEEGCFYLIGTTRSEDLPKSVNNFSGGEEDVFVAKMDSDGEILWTSYMGSKARESASDISIDSQGNIYVTGYTDMNPVGRREREIYADHELYLLPESLNKREFHIDAFATKMNTEGVIKWSKYLHKVPARPRVAINIDNDDNLYLVARDWVEDEVDGERTYYYAFRIIVMSSGGDVIYSGYYPDYPGGNYKDFQAYRPRIVYAGDNILYLSATIESKNLPGQINEFHEKTDPDEPYGGKYDIFVSRIRLPEIRDEAVGEDGVDENGDQ